MCWSWDRLRAGCFLTIWGAKFETYPDSFPDKVFLWGSLRTRKGFSSKWRTKQHGEILRVTSRAGIWKVSVPQKGDNRLEILTRTLNIYNFVTESFCSQCSVIFEERKICCPALSTFDPDTGDDIVPFFLVALTEDPTPLWSRFRGSEVMLISVRDFF